MRAPSHADAFEVLCLQAADKGRGDILFGDCLQRVRTTLRPFIVGNEMPSIYLEFPLAGKPFLDVTVLYADIDPGTRVDSDAAEGSEAMLDWFAGVCKEHNNICCGFEVDTKHSDVTAAAVHFQPRGYTQLVEPFCASVGEPERAALYLGLNERMPEGWALSFFGMFRGRPGSPLRVCGYLSPDTTSAYGEEPALLAEVFDQIGFTAYDDAMLSQVSELIRTAPDNLDFQFDIYPDGTLGPTFAIDAQFGIEQPEVVRDTFDNGIGARVMGLFERWGIADDRWRLIADAAFARAISVELEDGSTGRYAFTLMPQWVKTRWTDGVLQPAKLYHLANGAVLESTAED